MDGGQSCPHCGRWIAAGVKYCHFCGYRLGVDGQPVGDAYIPPPPPYAPARGSGVQGWVIGCIVAAVVLIVLVPLVGIIFAISIPNSVRIRDKAKEAEVKQNCHAIQLALERYATDHNVVYPLIIMGGDWTDSYVVWDEWVVQQGSLDVGMISDQERRFGWQPAGPDVGDALVMDGYMPSYPGNPFVKQQRQQARRIHHYPCPAPSPGTPPFWRIVGGRDSNRMYEVFGPAWLTKGQSIAGDYYVHHIFNEPPYAFEHDLYKTPPGGWTPPIGNSVLTGNFSYWPRGEKGTAWSLAGGSKVVGYTLAGYGALRTAGQDVYNRNGNYKGRFRTEPCESDCTANSYADDIPCICAGSAMPTLDRNNGGSDTIVDGVIITLDSGL